MKLLQDISNKKDPNDVDDEGDVESDEDQAYLNNFNQMIMTGAHGHDLM